MLGFLRSNLIGLIALVVALSGTAYAVSGAGVDGAKVHIHFGSPATGHSTSTAVCPTGQTVLGGGGESHSADHALSLSRPFKHSGSGAQGWLAASNGGGATAIAVCAEP